MTGVMGRPLVGAVRLAIATATNGRRRNEDAIGVGGWVLVAESPDPLELSVAIGAGRPALVALADGMGGHAAGDTAARIAAGRLTRSVPASADGYDEVFRRADDAIRDAASGELSGMGATAAAVRIDHQGLVSIANLGDVRAYRVVDGYLGQLTVDDRPAAAPGAAPSGAVTRWLGGGRRSVIEPHRCELTARPGDRFVLCTDGLHDAVSLSADHGLAAGSARSVARNLVAAAAADDGDNVTVVVLDLTGHCVEEDPGRDVRSGLTPEVVANLTGLIAPATNP
ncbi:MAG: PP2C family protein-serine/threonine phosphatase [Pseudonocardiaceae bacterium]